MAEVTNSRLDAAKRLLMERCWRGSSADIDAAFDVVWRALAERDQMRGRERLKRIDWPGRFEAAANEADEHGLHVTAGNFRWDADMLASGPAAAVEAIKRALEGR
jgi:hypothetical protein